MSLSTNSEVNIKNQVKSNSYTLKESNLIGCIKSHDNFLTIRLHFFRVLNAKIDCHRPKKKKKQIRFRKIFSKIDFARFDLRAKLILFLILTEISFLSETFLAKISFAANFQGKDPKRDRLAGF